MGNQEIKFVISGEDKSGQAVLSASNGLKYLEGTMTKLSVQITAFQGAWNAAMAVIGKGMAYINMGAEALRAEEAFGAMAKSIGVDADKMSASMKKAAAGFVDDSHLMQKAAFAMASDIDPEKIPQLFEAARLASRLTGQDVVSSIDGMIQAISTNMPRSLRQMGMISKEQMTVLNQAAAAGVTEVNLLDIVLANAAIKSAMLGDSQDNAAKQIKKFKVEIEELKEAVGKGLIDALQKGFGFMQLLAAASLDAASGVMNLVAGFERLSARMQSGIAQKMTLQVAAEHEETAKALAGAARELQDKGGANLTGVGEKGRGADPAAAAQAQEDLKRVMDDLKKRVASAKGKDAMDKLQEEWAKIERELNADIAKAGLDEFEKKLIDIDKKVADLNEKAAKLPAGERGAAAGKINSWAAAMKDQLASEDLQKEIDTMLASGADGRKALEDLDKSLTSTRSSELQKRLIQVDETAKKEEELAVQALLRRVITEEEYAAKEVEIALTAIREKERIQADHNKAVREMEINSRLAVLDLAEKEGLAHRKTLSERIALTRELIQSEEAHLGTMDKGKDESAWYAQSDKINAARKTFAELTREMTMTDPFGAMKLAMTDLENRWTDVGQQMYDVATSTAQAMQQAFSDFFFDTFQGKLKSLGDYVNSFLTSVQRAISNALSQQMSAGISSGIGSLFSGLSSGGGASAQGTVAAQIASYGEYAAGFHSGGIAGGKATFFRIVPNVSFAGAPRYHGGFAPDEYPAILQRGEGVFTPAQMKALGIMAGGGSQQPTVNENHVHVHLTVNALDARSVSQAIQQQADQIVGIITQRGFNKHGKRGPNG